MELTNNHCIDSYIHFSDTFYFKKYIVEVNTSNIADTFLSLLKKRFTFQSLGIDFLYQYLTFQFTYWNELTISAFDAKMKFAFIFGKKAFQRYLIRNEEYDWQLESNKVTALVTKSSLKTKLNIKDSFDRASNAETIYKVKFHNTEEGFANCILYTSLYDPKDNHCNSCIFKQDCKELLRMNYPHIYNERTIN